MALNRLGEQAPPSCRIATVMIPATPDELSYLNLEADHLKILFAGDNSQCICVITPPLSI
jgi:hypothetical protein